MMEPGVGKRLGGAPRSLSPRHMDSHDPAGPEIDHSRHIDLLSVLHELGEVRCPDVVCIGGHDREQEVEICLGNLGFSPFSASPAVGLDAKQTHDPLHPLAAESQCRSKSPGAVRGMDLQLFFQPDLEAPVLLLHSRAVIQACPSHPKTSPHTTLFSSFAHSVSHALSTFSPT